MAQVTACHIERRTYTIPGQRIFSNLLIFSNVQILVIAVKDACVSVEKGLQRVIAHEIYMYR